MSPLQPRGLRQRRIKYSLGALVGSHIRLPHVARTTTSAGLFQPDAASAPIRFLDMSAGRLGRRKPLLVNDWETRTDAALAEAASRCGVRVFPKVRVADVLDLDGSGLTDKQYRYGLRAHFDFVIADREDTTGQFAVEFDEPHHLTARQTLDRDRLKAQVCARFDFPLIRIGSSYLSRERRFTLIGYLVEVWHLERAFREAQESGRIPRDEPFDPALVISDSIPDVLNGEPLNLDFPYWLERPARLQFVAAEAKGLILARTPEEIVTPWPRHGEPDKAEFIEAWAVLELSSAGYVMGQAMLRNFKVFVPGVTARRLAADVAVADAGRKLARIVAGEEPPNSAEDWAVLRARTVGWLSQGGAVAS